MALSPDIIIQKLDDTEGTPILQDDEKVKYGKIIN